MDTKYAFRNHENHGMVMWAINLSRFSATLCIMGVQTCHIFVVLSGEYRCSVLYACAVDLPCSLVYFGSFHALCPQSQHCREKDLTILRYKNIYSEHSIFSYTLLALLSFLTLFISESVSIFQSKFHSLGLGPSKRTIAPVLLVALIVISRNSHLKSIVSLREPKPKLWEALLHIRQSALTHSAEPQYERTKA